uniref:Serine protease gd n=1 Tax=Culex pipiens TaxID=7175 RepID=A0A8D8F8E7_CULPI
MAQISINKVAIALTVICCLVCSKLTSALYLKSPCPAIFTYQVDPQTDLIYGLVEINNIVLGRVAKLNVDLSIGGQLPSNIVGSMNLLKSRESTVEDIMQGLPAQYRVNFPVQSILPTVLRIALNGQTICPGYRAQGRVITNINLEHTLYTQQLHSLLQNQNQNGQHSVELETRFQSQPQLQPLLRPQWNNPTARPGSLVRPNPGRTTVTPPASATSSCGKPLNGVLKRFSINGELVDKGQFPWLVPLFDRVQVNNPKYICGSTIITKRHLVTAAHCVYDVDSFMRPERILAVPGMYNVDNFFDENALIMDVDQIVPHDDYIPDDDTNDADVAALRMKNALEFTDYIIPICTWQGENDVSRIVGQEGFVAGWGHTETGSTAVPMFVRTTVVDRKQCNAHLQRNYQSHARVFCGDGHGTVPCNGDSGSGMIIRRGNQYFLRGVVSKGLVDPNTYKCDATRYSVYVDVALFRFWLRKVTQN